MNIIQVQDRLKGVSDDALKGYVTNPTGDVPTYLALGEIGRREDVRKEYQAAQAQQPQKTVAEEKLAELGGVPQGIGALTQGMMPPAPQGISQPPMASMNPAIAETGVANLPTPNMPQEFAYGGIVAPAIGYLGRTSLGKGVKKGLGYLKDKLFGTKGTYNPKGPKSSSTTMVPYNKNAVSAPGTFSTKGMLNSRQGLIDIGAGSVVVAGVTYMMGDDGKVVDEDGNPPPLDVAEEVTEQLTETEATPEPTMREKAQERMDLYKEFAGEDEGQARIQERIAKMDKRSADVEDQSFNDALIAGGLGIAGGQSSDFTTNFARGATKGFNQYEDSLDKMRELEKETFELDVEVNKAKRIEQLAIANKGIDSVEAQEAAQYAEQLQSQKDAALMERVQAQIEATGKIDEGDIMDLYGTMFPNGQTLEGEQMPYDIFRSNFISSMTSGGVSGNPDSGFGQMTVSE